MTASSDPLRFAAWIAVLLLALYVVFVGGGFHGVYIPMIRAASVALAGIGLLVWAAVALRRPAWRPRSVLLLAGVACLGAFALSTAVSRYPRVSLEYLGYALLLAVLYLLLVRLLADPFFRVRFGALAVLLCAIISVVFVVTVVRHWIDWWALVGRVTVPPLRPDFDGLTFGSPSAVLTITVLLLAPAVAHIGTRSRSRRAVVIVLAVLVAVAALLSGSRSGWFALGAAMLIVGALALATAGGRETIRRAARSVMASRPGRIAVALALGAGLVVLVALGPALLRRATEGGGDLRAAYIAAALRMFGEAPLAGTGPGTWVVQRIRYTIPPETDYYIPHAHDIYAQTLSELGLVGAIAGVVLLASIAWLIRGAIRDGDPERRWWGWLAAFAVIFFGANQVFDLFVNMPAVLFAAALPIAWLDATASTAATATGPRVGGRALPTRLWGIPALTVAVLVLVAVVGLEWSEIPASTHARAVALADAGAWGTADGQAHDAATTDPGLPPYHMTEGLTADRAGDQARAADAFRQVVEADDLPEAWLDLAAEETALGNTTAARSAIASALRLGYQRPAVAMAAGDLALRIGDEATARGAFTGALITTPSLAGDPWWALDPTRAALFASVREAAIQQGGPSTGWEIALVSGDYIGARSLAEQLDPASAANASRIVDAWSGDTAAFQAALDQCAARPLDVTALTWCARLQGHAGNDPEANRYRAWANTIVGNAYVAGAELRVNPDVQVGRSDAGNEALFYGYYTYRRPTPWDLLVPSLVHLTLE